MSIKIGFLINPIAGMGGRVGLKGTDGVYEKAKNLGAKKTSEKKAYETIREFIDKYNFNKQIVWYTCSKSMGENVLRKNNIKNINIVYEYDDYTTSTEDTIKACKKILENNPDLILYCGGDGTTRDIYSVIKDKIPILGIPSGVKMHSGVFGINTSASAKMLYEFINGNLSVGDADIMDLDEDLYRKGEWKVKLFGVAKGIVEPTYIQVGKASFQSISDDSIKEEIAEYIEDEMNENQDYLYLFGSGGTIDYISKKIGIKNTILGIDAIFKKKNINNDLNENQLLDLFDKYHKVKIILSPIGAQGFILGRGNLQLSPKVIRKIGIDNIIVISTPSKLKSTPYLRVDTGDKKLDREFSKKEMMMVVIGYRLSRIVKIQTNKF